MTLRILVILLTASSVFSEFLPFHIADQDAWLAKQSSEIRDIFDVSLSGHLKHVTPELCPLGKDWSNHTFQHPYTNDTLNACYWRPPLDDPNSVIARVHTYNDTITNSTGCPENFLEIGRIEGYYFHDNITESFEIPGLDNDSLYEDDGSLTFYCRYPYRHESCKYTLRASDLSNETCSVNESAVMVEMSDGMTDYTIALACEACDNEQQYHMDQCKKTNKTDRCPLFQVVGDDTTCKSCPSRLPQSRPPSLHSSPPSRSSTKLPHRVPPKALAILGVNFKQFSNILSMIGGSEQSTTIWSQDSNRKSIFSWCKNIGDGRGITVGIAGFTGSTLKKIIGPKVKNDCDDVKKLGNDPKFIDAQWKVYMDEIMTLVPKYYPKNMQGYPAKNPLIVGILLDTAVNAGESGETHMWGVREIAHNARGDNPKEWATSFLNLRNEHFTTGNNELMRVGRIKSWMKLVNGGHWDMDVDIRKFAYIPR